MNGIQQRNNFRWHKTSNNKTNISLTSNNNEVTFTFLNRFVKLILQVNIINYDDITIDVYNQTIQF